MSNGSRLLEVLLKVSEKAANIARACRQNDTLFKLLVQEKSEEEKNPRFFQDFKTLADVLIQETIRHDIGIEFPELAKKVKGEESNVFSNALGETVIVQVYPSPEETTQLLIKVLNNDTATATLLASEVHKKISLEDVPVSGSLVEDFNIDMDDLGIWIDPIDSTADYINGVELMDSVGKIHLSGLRCVTVLIGAYLGSTGLPILGVVNQPFYTQNNQSWTGICYWGSVNGDVGKSSLKNSKLSSGVVVLSRSEDPEVKAKLSNGGFSIVESSGAGYKILTVITGEADAYVLSKGSTYRWDTCAPQSILRSVGGGILDYSKFMDRLSRDQLDLKYSLNEKCFSNKGGLIAYRDPAILESLERLLSQ